jgi:hypothetical protein
MPFSARLRRGFAAIAAVSASRGSPPPWLVARRSKAQRGLDMPRRMDEDSAFKGSARRRHHEGRLEG